VDKSSPNAHESTDPGHRRGSTALRMLADFAPLRLLFYYAVVFGLLFGALNMLPGIMDALDHERTRHVAMGDVSFDASSRAPTTRQLMYSTYPAVVGVSILVALLLSIPVAWVYGWTSRRSSYSKSFAQTLVVFPIAVATVVFLVKGSLALAFSLAGIVAAVRFRSQLPETRDALFLFVVIGIGLATGVQLLLVALICSAAFNCAMLYVSSSDFGARPPRLNGLSLERDSKSADADSGKPDPGKAAS
jgi:hypothetical protein